MASHSKKFNLVRTYYKGGFWSKRQVENAVKKGWITSDEYEEITGEAYPEDEKDMNAKITSFSQTNIMKQSEAEE